MISLNVLSFNIHGGRSRDGRRDLRRVHDLMDEYNIDIGIFQEMETRTHRGGSEDDIAMLAGPSRPHHLHGPNMHHGAGWYGNLLVSRYPLLRATRHNLETSSWLEPRSAIDALIETPIGPVRIIGTHLSLLPQERLSEGRTLVRLMQSVEEHEKNPLFLMGDLNEWRGRSPLIKHLDDILTPLPCGASFPSFRPVLKLDRIWHNAKLAGTAQVLSTPSIRLLSDHLPVKITIASG